MQQVQNLQPWYLYASRARVKFVYRPPFIISAFTVRAFVYENEADDERLSSLPTACVLTVDTLAESCSSTWTKPRCHWLKKRHVRRKVVFCQSVELSYLLSSKAPREKNLQNTPPCARLVVASVSFALALVSSRDKSRPSRDPHSSTTSNDLQPDSSRAFSGNF